METALPALLPLECLVELNESHYGAQRTFWADENARGLFAAEARLLERLAIRDGRALCVACGAGREALALAGRGFDVVGVEEVGSFVEHARRCAVETGARARFVRGDATRLAEALAAGGRFDLITLLNVAYSYVPTRAARVGLLRECRRRLAEGGRCVVSFVTSEPSRPERLLRALLRPAALVLGNRGHELGDRVIGTGNFIHFFPRMAVVDDEAREAGFARRELFLEADYGPLGVLSE